MFDPFTLGRRLIRWEPVWLLLLTPLILFPGRFIPPTWHPGLIALLFLGWPLRRWVHGRWTVSTPLNGCIGVIACWLPINLWASADRALSWQHIGYLVLGIAFYFALVNWPVVQAKPPYLVWTLIGIGVTLAPLGVVLLASYPSKLFQLPQLQLYFQPVTARLGDTIHPNVLSGALTMICPFAATATVYAYVYSLRFQRLLFTLSFVLIFGALVLTQSRGGYLGTAVALGLLMLILWPRLLYVLPLLVLTVGVIMARMGNTTAVEFLVTSETIGGLDGRLEVWNRALYAISDFPFTGIGIGTFPLVVPQLYPFFLNPAETVPHAHNLWLQIAVDLGLPGFIAFLALMLTAGMILFSMVVKREKHLNWFLALGGLTSLVAVNVHGILDAALWGNKLAFLPWLLFVVVALLAREQRCTGLKDSCSDST